MLATLRTVFLFIPAVSLSTILCGIVSLLLAIVWPGGEASHRVACFWARLLLRTCGVRVEFEGAERLEKDQVYVFASNHQSLFDIPILFARLPSSFRILYKESLHGVPFIGWHLYLSGHIPVNRTNPIRARRSLEKAAERIRRGTAVVVFPEGTRSRDGSVGRFKGGSFLLAVKAGVPVVPVTISESWRVMSRGRVTVHPGLVRVVVGRLFSVEGFDEDSVGELSQAVREVVARNYITSGGKP